MPTTKKDNVISIRVTALDKSRLADLRMFYFEHTGELYSFSEIIRALIRKEHEAIGGGEDGEAENADV